MRTALKLFLCLLLPAVLLAACGGGEEAAPVETPPPAQGAPPQTEAPSEDPGGEGPPADAEGGDEASMPPAASDPDPVPASDTPTGGDVTAEPNPALLDPSQAVEQAPATFKVRFETTKGGFVVQATRDWSPRGVDRFYNLVRIGFFNDIAFFRVLQGFIVQFGIHGDPAIASAWRGAAIQDEPVVEGNIRGRLVYAKGGPNTRTTQLFINLVDNRASLDPQGFPAIAEVIEGMDVVDQLFGGYGEGAPRGRGPNQMQIQSRGNAYLKKDFPRLDYVVSAEIVE